MYCNVYVVYGKTNMYYIMEIIENDLSTSTFERSILENVLHPSCWQV